jgi:hypothetical protein
MRLSRFDSLSLIGSGVFDEIQQIIPNLDSPADSCKCLWKWMFFGHSQFFREVALWMLHNLKHPS